MCGDRHTQFGYNQGRLGDETLLEKCSLCVIGNDNVLNTTAVVHLSPNKVFWDLCGHDAYVPCPQFSALQKWAAQIRQPWHHSPMWQFGRRSENPGWRISVDELRA